MSSLNLLSMKYYKLNKSFLLERGQTIDDLQVAYHTYGQLNRDKSNVIWVCHALTANSDVLDWWSGLFGVNKYFDPQQYFIVCANVLGSHYGTTNPLSVDLDKGKPYYKDFPLFSMRDISRLHIELANHLGIEKINTLIGGSIGGQQALEWSILEPNRINNLVLLATNAVHSSWGIAFNESQRWAIENDPTWADDNINSGLTGMRIARSVALLSYRNYKTYEKSQQRVSEKLFPIKAGSYQKYQGEKLAKRFNAYSYWYLSKAMDSHDVGRGRGSVEKALESIQARTIIFSFHNDILFPKSEQEFLSRYIPHATLFNVATDYGHDGFLIETDKIEKVLQEINWLNKLKMAI